MKRGKDIENFEEIQRLLRLKRYERPAPGFEDRFLAEFHRRQSAAFVHTPLWRIALDRFGVWLGGEDPAPRRAFGTAGFAAATVLIVAGMFFSDRWMPQPVGQAAVASASSERPMIQLETSPVNFSSRKSPSEGLMNPDLEFVYLLSPGQFKDRTSRSANVELDRTLVDARRMENQRNRPSYVLDTRLVSHEPSSF